MGREPDTLGRGTLTRSDFFRDLSNVLEWDGTVDETTALHGSDRWDSVAKLSTIMFINERFGIIVGVETLDRATNVGDLANLVSDRLDS